MYTVVFNNRVKTSNAQEGEMKGKQRLHQVSTAPIIR